MDAARSREEGAAREDARGEDKKTARTERGDGRERGGEGASRSGVGQRAVPFANAPICSDVAYRRAKPGRPRRARSEASHRRHGGCYFMYLRKVRTSARAEGEFEVFNGGIEPSTDRRVFGWSGAIRALFRRAGLNLVSTSDGGGGTHRSRGGGGGGALRRRADGRRRKTLEGSGGAGARVGPRRVGGGDPGVGGHDGCRGTRRRGRVHERRARGRAPGRLPRRSAQETYTQVLPLRQLPPLLRLPRGGVPRGPPHPALSPRVVRGETMRGHRMQRGTRQPLHRRPVQTGVDARHRHRRGPHQQGPGEARAPTTLSLERGGATRGGSIRRDGARGRPRRSPDDDDCGRRRRTPSSAFSFTAGKRRAGFESAASDGTL